MSDRLTVIYAAATVQQAYLLKNLLEDQGIQAVVTNAALEGGSGVDIVGWPTQPRVVVAEQDAERAREIAVQFDQTVSAEPELTARAEAAVDADEGVDFWPRCPGCGARRSTRCPICETAGTDFPLADSEYLSATPAAAEAEPSSDGCGRCTSHGQKCEPARAPGSAEPGEDTAETDSESASQVPELMVTCTTCDEPFVPRYPRRCEWCGHEFDDGFAVDEIQLMEPITGRTIVVVLGLLALGAGLVVYFKVIM